MQSCVIPKPHDGLKQYKAWFEETVNTVPDLSYIGMTAVTNLPAIPTNIAADVAIGLDYVSGICAIALGVQQLTDKENYRQTQLKIQGMLNIISGIQLFIFSYSGNNAMNQVATSGMATLAAPAFAFAMLCDALNAAIDFANADKEVTFTGWLEERVKEVNYLDQRLSGSTGEVLPAEKIQELKDKKTALIQDMQSRCRVNYTEANNPVIRNHLNQLTDAAIHNTDFYLEATESDRLRDNQLQRHLSKTREEKRNELLIRTIGFIGMALSAITVFTACPPLAIAATVICSLIAVFQLYQRVLKPGYHRFFAKPETKHTLLKQQPLEPATNVGLLHGV